MHLEKHLKTIVEKYDNDDLYRIMCNHAFSAQLTNKEMVQPGAIKVGNIIEESRKKILENINEEDWTDQKSTENIPILVFGKGIDIIDGIYYQKSEFIKGYEKYNDLIDFGNRFADQVGKGELRGLSLVNLLPGKEIYEHFESDCYYMIRDRYHVVLEADEDNIHIFENEEFKFKQGEIWWYNIKIRHKTKNNSQNNRIHLIIDVVPYKNLNIEPILTETVYNKINKGFSLDAS